MSKMEERLSSVDTNTTSYTSSISDSSSDEEILSRNMNLKRKHSYDDSNEDMPKMPRFEKASHSFDSTPEFSYNKDYKSDDSENYSEKVPFSPYQGQSEKRHMSHYDTDLSDYKDGHQFQNTSLEKNLDKAPKLNVKDERAIRMMKMMGYKEGKGLGKHQQGIVEPVEASTQKGHRGLGYELQELKQVSLEYRPEEEVIKVVEDIHWLENRYEQMISEDDLIYWKNNRLIGTGKKTIDNETHFCDEFIVRNIVASKSGFDRLEKNEMRQARTRSNPFETIRGAIFLNRAAVKMANMDRACNFMFTQADKQLKDELLYFADVCAGPGGFSEYVLWRKKWRAKGFGFTLKGSNDFKLEDFIAGSSDTFHPYYGPANDGDVYNPENQIAFRDLIMSQTDHKGVHFMMADGGFSVEGEENIQEILSKQLYLCQCLVALMIVCTGGHFVTKVFDLFTPFSAGLIYIMHRCFRRVSIFKPNTSRPANSERYLICQSKKSDINHVIDYLFKINEKLNKNGKAKDSTKDILEIVPLGVLLADKDFFNYLKNSNEILGQNQIVGLKKIAAFAEDRNLVEKRQNDMRKECLKYWDIPDESRIFPRSRIDPQQKFQSLLLESAGILQKIGHDSAIKLTKDNVVPTVLSGCPFDYYCMPCSGGEFSNDDSEPTFYLGMERSIVYRYDRSLKRWKKFDVPLVLPCNTLIYAQLTQEYRNEGQRQMRTQMMHVIDAFNLGSTNITNKFFTDRHRLIKLFCEALWKPDICVVKDSDNPIPIKVRAKELISASEIGHKLDLVPKLMKKGFEKKAFMIKTQSYENSSDDLFYIPQNILFLKSTAQPWHYGYSQKNQLFYFNNSQTRISRWENEGIPPDAVSDFAKTIENRILWNWPSDNTFTIDHFMQVKQNHESHKQ